MTKPLTTAQTLWISGLILSLYVCPYSFHTACLFFSYSWEKVKEVTSALIYNFKLCCYSKSAISEAIYVAENSWQKVWPFEMTGQEDKLCFNENGAKNQKCCLSLLLVSRGRHQSRGEPVAKKQHAHNWEAGERTGHATPAQGQGKGTSQERGPAARLSTHSGPSQTVVKNTPLKIMRSIICL